MADSDRCRHPCSACTHGDSSDGCRLGCCASVRRSADRFGSRARVDAGQQMPNARVQGPGRERGLRDEGGCESYADTFRRPVEGGSLSREVAALLRSRPCRMPRVRAAGRNSEQRIVPTDRATGPARRHCPRRLPADGVYWIPWQDPCWPPARASDGRAGPVGAGESEAPAARTVHAFRQPMACAGASESGGGAGPVYRPESSAARPSRWRDSFPTDSDPAPAEISKCMTWIWPTTASDPSRTGLESATGLESTRTLPPSRLQVSNKPRQGANQGTER